MQTTDDIAFIVFNNGSIDDLIKTHLYSNKMFAVEIAEDVWARGWNYSDRIIITFSSNLKPNLIYNDEVRFIRYQDLAELGKGIQESILNQLKRNVQRWQQ